MIERTFMVRARLGLHARAAAKLVRVAAGFQSQLSMERIDTGTTADAKSILSVLMLAATRGTELRVRADGVDEQEAMLAFDSLFEQEFGEVSPAVN